MLSPSPLPEKKKDNIRYLVFDTETTGLPADGVSKNEDTCRASQPEDWPEIVQLTAEVWEIKDGVHSQVGEVFNWFINIEGEVPKRASSINGITKAFLEGKAQHGMSGEVLDSAAPYFPEVKEEILALMNDKSIDFVVAHNMPYDEWVLRQNIARHGGTVDDLEFEREGYDMVFDSAIETKTLCKMVWLESGELKRPRLVHLYGILFPGEEFPDAHDAREDVKATVRVIHELYKRGIFNPEERKRRAEDGKFGMTSRLSLRFARMLGLDAKVAAIIQSIKNRGQKPARYKRNLAVDWDRVAEDCKVGHNGDGEKIWEVQPEAQMPEAGRPREVKAVGAK